MLINFHIGFKSQHGETLLLSIIPFNSDKISPALELELHYKNESCWHGSVDREVLGSSTGFEYNYIYRNEHTGIEKVYSCNTRINLERLNSGVLNIEDDWNKQNLFEDVFSSKPFSAVFKRGDSKISASHPQSPTHIFSVKAPALADGKVVCITGGDDKLRNWDVDNPLLMDFENGSWNLNLDLSCDNFPIEYKLGIYDVRLKKMDFEQGENRVLGKQTQSDSISLLLRTINTENHRWKGAGVNIPLTSLRSVNSWGVGDFSDLNLLTDISKACGIKLIQLLPINDTTSTHTNKDSYPYSAVSAFALHPIYLDVDKLAIALSVKIKEDIRLRVKVLNTKDSLQYEEVLSVKNDVLKELYRQNRKAFEKDPNWVEFFRSNRHWLIPYAAFCYLRDENKTADYNSWGKYETYQEELINDLVNPKNDFYESVAIHYFAQYHLHLQLKNAVDYAHKSGIIIKGDLPIGVGRHSADAWMYRDLFHMDMQAGAPPDAFATKGQNWSFPTYNWEKMALDDFAWWRQRMAHMGNYFDAIRIDHVLGFFRIWSIPYGAVEGILGKFEPSWPVSHEEISNAGVHFSEERFCEPFITEQLLHDWFGTNASVVKDTFLANYRFMEEFNSQRKIAEYLKTNPTLVHLKNGLFDLLSNIIAIKDDIHPYNYHFRINMHDTESFKALPFHEKDALRRLYDVYYYEKQNQLWKEEGVKKLTALKRSTNMLICAEDLGMVPVMVEGVLSDMQMLALEVQRMPKKINDLFSNPARSPYLSVVTPSTHDMSTIREWWQEDYDNSTVFFLKQLGYHGETPASASTWLCQEVIDQHLQSPAMWAVFLLQDLLSMDEGFRIDDPQKERINNPADPNHYWNYRMYVTLEQLKNQTGYIEHLKQMIEKSGR